MRSKLANFLLHALGLALVCAIAAYWVIRIATPAPTAAPPPLAAAPARNVDPILAARMFGLVQTAAVAASNVQVAGVYVAGARSAAILVVDGKPPRTYVQGAQIAPDTVLAEVHADRVVLDSRGARQELRTPLRPAAVNPSTAPAPGFTREGNVLSAPTVTAAAANARGPGPGAIAPPLPAPAMPELPVAVQPPAPPPVPLPSAAQVQPVQPGIATEAPPAAQGEEEEAQRPARRRRSPLAGGAPGTN